MCISVRMGTGKAVVPELPVSAGNQCFSRMTHESEFGHVNIDHNPDGRCGWSWAMHSRSIDCKNNGHAKGLKMQASLSHEQPKGSAGRLEHPEVQRFRY